MHIYFLLLILHSLLVGGSPFAPTCVSKVIPTSNIGSYDNELVSVSGVPNDVWAVGDYRTSVYYEQRTLIEHFDGSSWTISPSPDHPRPSDRLDNNTTYIPGYDQLLSVSRSSSTDAWAVGGWGDFGSFPNAFALRWNGSSWTELQNPPGSGQTQGFASVSANPTNPNDVWVVGWIPPQQRGEYPFVLAENWNGTTWQSSSTEGIPFSVTTAPDGEAWAVGIEMGEGNFYSIIHWDGQQWLPQASTGSHDRLYSVDALSATDVWAVGDRIENYNGSIWQRLQKPKTPDLHSVSAISATDAWAVGGSSVLHWNGVKWYLVPQPNVGSTLVLNAVQALPTGAITVGSVRGSDGYSRTFSSLISCR